MNGPVPDAAGWRQEQHPFAPAQSEAQIDGLRRWLDPAPKRVLDLGCGAGRVLVPLAECGHRLVGVDRDAAALGQCARDLEAAGVTAELLHADWREGEPLRSDRFDAVLCLGNTFMTVSDVDEAVQLLRSAAARLDDGGAVLIDDIPADLWPELAHGHWQSGLTADGQMQMAWAERDAVFTVRHGAAVDPGTPTPVAGDRLFRLWCDGSLRLAAQLAGLSAPAPIAHAHLIAMPTLPA